MPKADGTVGLEKIGFLRLAKRGDLFFDFGKLLPLRFDNGGQISGSLLRRAVRVIRNTDPFEVKGSKDVVDRSRFGCRRKVDAPIVFLVAVKGKEEKLPVVIIGKLFIAVAREPAKAGTLRTGRRKYRQS